MKSFYLMSILLFFSPFLSSCTQKEVGCSSDAECRFDRTCQEGTCTGEVDLQPTNNVQNNGVNNNLNNQNNVANNGNTNNQNNNGNNNGSNNVDGCSAGCPGNAICEEGICVELCDSNTDCPSDEACTARFEAPGNQCREADTCFLEDYFVADLEVCSAQLSCDNDIFASIQCAFTDEDAVSCFCENEFESVEFEQSASVCFELEILIDLLNQNCGARIRDF